MSNYQGMHNPMHPGEVLKEGWLEPLGLSVTKAAELLGVSRKTLSGIVNGHAPVTPGMAMRIELVFGHRAGYWLELQATRDAWEVEAFRKQIAKTVTRYQPEAA